MIPPRMLAWFDDAAARAAQAPESQRGSMLDYLRRTQTSLARLDEYLDGGPSEPAIAVLRQQARALQQLLRVDLKAMKGLHERAWQELARLTSEAGTTRLVWVPDFVRALSVYPLEEVRAWLLAMRRGGAIELRPECGVGRISPGDAALCPTNSDGVPLSHVLVLPDKPT